MSIRKVGKAAKVTRGWTSEGQEFYHETVLSAVRKEDERRRSGKASPRSKFKDDAAYQEHLKHLRATWNQDQRTIEREFNSMRNELDSMSKTKPLPILLVSSKKRVTSIEQRVAGSTRTSRDLWSPVWATSYVFKKGYYLFKGSIYKSDKDGYSLEEVLHQILDAEERESRKLDRLEQKFGKGSGKQESKQKREFISEEVRIAVWRRDGGTCVRCGSRERLEYDHIIPVSLGGSSTTRNIELLCEPCNRSKSNRIQ